MVYLCICLCYLQFLLLASYSFLRQGQPTPALLPGKFHGLRSLVGYSPWGRKESDTTEQLHFHYSFLEYRSFASLGRFIPRYFILFDVMVNEIVSLISLSDLLLLVYRNARDFCINFVSCNFTEFINELW